MRNCNGNASIDFQIERGVNKTTNQYLTWKEYEETNADDPNIKWIEIELTVEGSYYFQKGRTYGEPENCYPDEGDTEIFFANDKDGVDWLDKLSDDEKERINELIKESVEDMR